MDNLPEDTKVEVPNEEVHKTVYAPELTTPIKNPVRCGTIRYAFLGMFLFLVPTILQVISLAFISVVRNFLQQHWQLVYVAMILYAASTFIFALLPDIRMKNPASVISGIVMVESLAVLITIVSTNHHYQVTLSALAGTIIICLLLTVTGMYCTIHCNMKKANTIILTMGLLLLVIGVFIYILELFVPYCPVNTVYSFLALFCMCIYFFHALQGLNNAPEIEDDSEKNIVAVYLYANFMAIFFLCEFLFASFVI